MHDLISIVIPVYNAENYIDRCIKSILKQTYINFELIIVNDGSTDNTSNICYQYAHVDSRIRLISQKNHGVSKARNRGIINAEGRYIVFIDADDYIETEYIQNLYNLISRNNVDFCCISYKTEISETEDVCLLENDIKLSGEDAIVEMMKPSCKIPRTPWGKMFKLEQVININFESEYSLAEDTLYNLEVFLLPSIQGVYNNYKGYIYTLSDIGIDKSTFLKRDISNNSVYHRMYSVTKMANRADRTLYYVLRRVWGHNVFLISQIFKERKFGYINRSIIIDLFKYTYLILFVKGKIKLKKILKLI